MSVVRFRAVNASVMPLGCIRHASRIKAHVDSHADAVPVSTPSSSPDHLHHVRSLEVVVRCDPYPTVPSWLETWPHLFTYIPRVAHRVWTSICSSKLGEVFNLYRASDREARDKLILEFLQLHDCSLGAANQSKANEHLAK